MSHSTLQSSIRLALGGIALALVGFVSPLTSLANPITQQSKETNMNSNEDQQIETLLFAYRDALNASDVSQVLTLYSQDGVFMPSGAPTSVGQEQVKGAYEYVFSSIQLDIEFHIQEIAVFGDHAYAQTTSKGTVLIRATEEKAPEENRELFVLKKEAGSWKIHRYMFNKAQ